MSVIRRFPFPALSDNKKIEIRQVLITIRKIKFFHFSERFDTYFVVYCNTDVSNLSKVPTYVVRVLDILEHTDSNFHYLSYGELNKLSVF